MLVAGETLHIFLLTGISKIIIFFIKTKKVVVIYGNIHDKFSSTNQKTNLKHKRKELENEHYKQIFKTTNQIDFYLKR